MLKFSAAKDKIQGLKIKDPALISFLYRYEPLLTKAIEQSNMNWDSFKGIPPQNVEYELQKIIRQKFLVDFLMKIIDPSQSNFANWMTGQQQENFYVHNLDINKEVEANRNNPDPRIQEIIKMAPANPGEATKRFVELINIEKQQSFYEWWQYLTQGDEVHAKNPAFIFLMMYPIVNMSNSQRKNPPPSCNATAVASVADQLEKDPQISVRKFYGQALTKANLEKIQKVDISNQWVFIPGNKKDPKNIDANIKLLQDLSSGNGWCTSAGMANTHLKQQGNDFFLLIKDNRAKVAIRVKSSGEVEEIQGINNKAPVGDWEDVIGFLHNGKLTNYKNEQHYREILKLYDLNADAAKGGDTTRALLERVRNDPSVYLQLSQENRDRFPMFTEVYKESVVEEINKNLSIMKNKYSKENNIMEAIHNNEILLSDMPVAIKNQLPLDFKEIQRDTLIGKLNAKGIYVWHTLSPEDRALVGKDTAVAIARSAIRKEINGWENLPAELKAPLVGEIKDLVVKFFSQKKHRDRYTWEGTKTSIRNMVPEEMQQAMAQEQWANFTGKMDKKKEGGKVNIDSSFYDGLADNLAKYIPKEDQIREWIYLLGYSPRRIDRVPKIIQKEMQDKNILREIMTAYLKRNPNIDAYSWNALPDIYKDAMDDESAVISAQGIVSKFISNVQRNNYPAGHLLPPEMESIIPKVRNPNNPTGPIWQDYVNALNKWVEKEVKILFPRLGVEFLTREPTPLEKVTRGIYPSRGNELLPEHLKRYITPDSTIKGWKKYIKEQPGDLQYAPDFVRQAIPVKDAFKHYWKNKQRYFDPEQMKQQGSHAIYDHRNAFYDFMPEFGKHLAPKAAKQSALWVSQHLEDLKTRGSVHHGSAAITVLLNLPPEIMQYLSKEDADIVRKLVAEFKNWRAKEDIVDAKRYGYKEEEPQPQLEANNWYQRVKIS